MICHSPVATLTTTMVQVCYGEPRSGASYSQGEDHMESHCMTIVSVPVRLHLTHPGLLQSQEGKYASSPLSPNLWLLGKDCPTFGPKGDVMKSVLL